jgi:two-component system response regulator MprA
MDAGLAHVLLVDDDTRSVRRLAQMLREDGFDVEVALDGARAIARLSHGRIPDVVVTDVRMPFADGIAVARYARSRRPDVLVIVVTSYPHLASPLEDGTFDPPPVVLTKPLEYAALRAALSDPEVTDPPKE